MYATYEEDHGLIKRAMAVYDRATKVVADADKFEVSRIADLTLSSWLTLLSFYLAIYSLPCKSCCELRSTRHSTYL